MICNNTIDNRWLNGKFALVLSVSADLARLGFKQG
jgi:hypothetical protein